MSLSSPFRYYWPIMGLHIGHAGVINIDRIPPLPNGSSQAPGGWRGHPGLRSGRPPVHVSTYTHLQATVITNGEPLVCSARFWGTRIPSQKQSNKHQHTRVSRKLWNLQHFEGIVQPKQRFCPHLLKRMTWGWVNNNRIFILNNGIYVTARADMHRDTRHMAQRSFAITHRK